MNLVPRDSFSSRPSVTSGRALRSTRQRRERIVRLLAQHGSARVSELSERFRVSAATIRTDLACIESQGYARRIHGGAKLVQTLLQGQDVHRKERESTALEEVIGARAAQLVRSGDRIIISSGAITTTLARHLRDHRDLTVMTNGLNIAWELTDADGVVLMLAGGSLRKRSLSLQGTQAEACLNAYSFDTLFLGADGLHRQFGLTAHYEMKARLDQRMVERARKVVVLTAASSLGRISLHRIAPLQRLHVVITDAGISPEYRDALQRIGVQVLVATSPEQGSACHSSSG